MRQRPQLLHHAVLRAAHRPDPVAGVVGPELHRHRPFQHRANALVHRLGRGPLRVPDRGRDLQNVAARHRPASCRRAGTRSRRKHTPPLPGQAAGRAEGRPRRVRLRQSRPRDIDRAPLVGRRTAGLGGRSGDKAGPFEIVTVVRTCREMEWARTILGNWAEAPAASGPSDPARREIACIEQAIRGMDDAVIEKHGGLQGCLERIVELKDLLRSASAHQTSGVDGHENALPTGTSALAHVVGRLAVAPRPPERRRRSGTCGRGWERPPLRDAWYGIGEGRHGHAHAILRRGSLPTSDPSRKGVGPMRPATLAIIGTALGAAAGHAFRAPFPGPGGNPVLDLIAYHDPGFHTAIRVWHYAAPAVAVVLFGSLGLSVWRVWLQPRAGGGGRGTLPPWPASPEDETPSLVNRRTPPSRRPARERAAVLARRSRDGAVYGRAHRRRHRLRQDHRLHVSVRPAAPLVAGRPARAPGQRPGTRGQGRLLPQVRQYDRAHRPMRSRSIP